MEFVDVMREYFRGERLTGLVLIPVGLAALGFAWHLWREHAGGFMWGMVVPLVLIGLGYTGGGAFLAARSDRQMDELSRLYQASPADVVAQEQPRMARVNANWPRLKTSWFVLIGITCAALLTLRIEWLRGTSLVLLMFAAMAMTLDTLAERRAEVYTVALDDLAARR